MAPELWRAEPATRSSAGPRVIEPPKPEDRFGREDTREPDLFSSLTPPPRSNRSAPQESPARPKSPSSVLARASADSAAESTVDLDVPTFDRRGVRPPVDAPRSARTQRSSALRGQPTWAGVDSRRCLAASP